MTHEELLIECINSYARCVSKFDEAINEINYRHVDGDIDHTKTIRSMSNLSKTYVESLAIMERAMKRSLDEYNEYKKESNK